MCVPFPLHVLQGTVRGSAYQRLTLANKDPILILLALILSLSEILLIFLLYVGQSWKTILSLAIYSWLVIFLLVEMVLLIIYMTFQLTGGTYFVHSFSLEISDDSDWCFWLWLLHLLICFIYFIYSFFSINHSSLLCLQFLMLVHKT